MILLLRLLPLGVAALQIAAFGWQLQQPSSYPWVVLLGVLALPAAAFVICWKRVRLADAVSRMAPSFILLGSLAFALLLVESRWAVWIAIALAVGTCLISLELLFLLAYDPARYPVNGLSRVNIAYVPIAVWYAAATSSGLIVFLHAERSWHVIFMTLLGAVLFHTTDHQDSTLHGRAVWTSLGALVGAHVGLLGILLPLNMPTQGIIASVLLSAALRVRRYLYDPKPSMRQAWFEVVGVFAAFVMALTSAKWL